MGNVLGGIAAGVLIGYPFGGVLYDFRFVCVGKPIEWQIRIMYKCIISHSGKTAPFVIISVVTVAVLAGQIIFIPNISNADEV